jgi:hypothetical protein
MSKTNRVNHQSLIVMTIIVTCPMEDAGSVDCSNAPNELEHDALHNMRVQPPGAPLHDLHRTTKRATQPEDGYNYCGSHRFRGH